MDPRNATFEMAGNAPRDAERGLGTLTPKEQGSWRDAVTFYLKGPSRKDPVSDAPLARLVESLSRAENAASLAGVKGDPGVLMTLEQTAPIYRRVWWPEQHRANESRRDESQKLVGFHGREILAYITNAYRMEWPVTGYTVLYERFRIDHGAESVEVVEKSGSVMDSEI